MKLSEIKLNPDNPREISEGKLEKLKYSIKSFPEMMSLRPIVVDSDGVILGGNMRYRALKELGYKEVDDEWIKKTSELTEEQKREFVIKDNTGFGDWDYGALDTDWDEEELDDWGLEVFDVEPEVEEDDFQQPDEDEIETDIQEGDLIEIGRHRLLCGDSTDKEQVEYLMDGKKVDISFTSPPYNAGTTPTEVKMGKDSKYANDDDNKTKEEYLNLLVEFTNNAISFSKYTFVNIQSLSGNKIALIDYLYEMKSVYADTMIWQKKQAQPAMAENVLNSQFEYIHVFSDKANRAIGTKMFRGTLSNVIEMSKQTNNEVSQHNATFPVEFASHFISNFCDNSLLDLFIGTGTTMVAAHQLNRKCYGLEIDPKYCQVVMDRMLELDDTLEIKINGEKYG